MLSAFGVDHGDFSKGFNPLKILGGAKKAKAGAMLPSEHFADPFKGGKKAAASGLPRTAASHGQQNRSLSQIKTPAGHGPGMSGMGRFSGSGPAQAALPKAQSATMEERSRAGGVGRLGVRNYSGNTRIRGGGF
jgi:hypothetical protein